MESFVQQFLSESSAAPKTPARKSTKISAKTNESKEKTELETEQEKRHRQLSEYQEITKKMSIQNSQTTNELFANNPNLWHQYHDARDFSFLGYKEQEEIPVNKIISYLKTKENRRLRILDLGCGRNQISKYFESNRNFDITGYDHISHNGSVACDISNLPDENESVNICIFSQSLMGQNWQKYILEAKRVLIFNGMIIISESSERYNIIKEFVKEIGFKILDDQYDPTNRWFYIYGINN